MNQIVKTTNLIPQLDVDTGMQSLRRVVSSAAFAGVEHNYPDDEMRSLLVVPGMSYHLETALAFCEQRDAPPRDDVLLGEVARFMALMGGSWTQENREAYLVSVMDELIEYPADLVIEAVRRARKQVRSERAFVSWICEQIEPIVARRKAERDRLAKLAHRYQQLIAQG